MYMHSEQPEYGIKYVDTKIELSIYIIKKKNTDEKPSILPDANAATKKPI